MKRSIPTRIIETGRLARGASGQGVGWLQSLAERFRNLRAQIQGVQERLSSPLTDGFPSCVLGELTFKADELTVITIPQYPSNPDSIPSTFIVPLLVNPIMLSGQTYRIPITFTPPGVLYAHNLVVGIEAGYTMFANQNRPGITPLNDYRQFIGNPNDSGFCPKDPTDGVIQYSYQQQVLGSFATVIPYIPFLWNIVDEKSGRQYAQDLMPHGALLQTRGYSSGNSSSDLGSKHPNADSELFEFDTPWIFERDAQVSFLFRPLMDLYQIAANDANLPYGSFFDPADDRSGGRRFEQATVRVEFHGNRYYTGQDVLKDGAFVTDSEPRRHPYNVEDKG